MYLFIIYIYYVGWRGLPSTAFLSTYISSIRMVLYLSVFIYLLFSVAWSSCYSSLVTLHKLYLNGFIFIFLLVCLYNFFDLFLFITQGGVVFLLLLSFYWTLHVVKNVVHGTPPPLLSRSFYRLEAEQK
ncbi:hypothetical protein T492DRAFT_304221 [Pavlovales sp. CCMP2436]|nr:hypothetical protein T492DRAFT_304221 [Pavlovales sp. CCMP2436]